MDGLDCQRITSSRGWTDSDGWEGIVFPLLGRGGSPMHEGTFFNYLPTYLVVQHAHAVE